LNVVVCGSVLFGLECAKKLFSVDPPRGGYGRKRDERGRKGGKGWGVGRAVLVFSLRK